jgi:hypothetical protein
LIDGSLHVLTFALGFYGPIQVVPTNSA